MRREHFKVVTGHQKVEDEDGAGWGQDPPTSIPAMGKVVFSALYGLSSLRPSAVLPLSLESCTFPPAGSV